MKLIDPKMSIDTIKSYIEVWDCKGCLPYGETQHNVMAVDDLQYLPTIEAEPVRHGRWIHSDSLDYKDPNGVIHVHGMCSCCRLIYDFRDMTSRFKFCPNCGSRMDADHIADASKKVGGAKI